jgi:triphosphatase
MAIETEIKYKVERAAWEQIKADFERDHRAERIEEQTNQYYTDTKGELNKRKIGLRLRLLPDATILTIKLDSKDGIKREETEEMYPPGTDTLPPDSPALQALLQKVGCSYDEIVPLVMMTTRRTVYLIREPGLVAEVCFDDVAILDICREHKLYEIEFELLEGEEKHLFALVDSFEKRYSGQLIRSTVTKLAYALQLVSCR